MTTSYLSKTMFYNINLDNPKNQRHEASPVHFLQSKYFQTPPFPVSLAGKKVATEPKQVFTILQNSLYS